jgi:hypothetical protein
LKSIPKGAFRATATSELLAGSYSHRPVAQAVGVPGSGGVAHRTPDYSRSARVHPALLVAAVLVAVWLLVDPRTPDLAAQVYRVNLFAHTGFGVWDEHWYAGHHLPGYSLLFAPLGALLGVRITAALAVLMSVALFERLMARHYGAGARWGAVWFAVAAVSDAWSGRLTFALGVAFALAAVLACAHRRNRLCVALSVLCAASSPVAGVLLALAGVTHTLTHRSPRAALVLAAPVGFVLAPLALLFPEGGFEPYPVASFAATVAVVLGFLWTLPPDRRLLRLGAVLYLMACLASLVIHSPLGSNIERYAVLLAGPLLVCTLVADRSAQAQLAGSHHADAWALGRRPAVAVCMVLGGIALWVLWGPVRETLAIAGNASTRASYYAPVKRFLSAHGGATVRVEVPFTRSHWEAALLAPSVSLARGWEKQLDTKYDAILLESGLTVAGYERWLHTNAVSYVALPDTPLDPSSAQEGALIRRGLPYLREVFASKHWRIFAVLDPTPIVLGPGRLTFLGHDSFTLGAVEPGRFLVRVRYTRYWTLTRGRGCVARAPGGWTAVTARAPGTVSVAARFSFVRALGLDSDSAVCQ